MPGFHHSVAVLP